MLDDNLLDQVMDFMRIKDLARMALTCQRFLGLFKGLLNTEWSYTDSDFVTCSVTINKWVIVYLLVHKIDVQVGNVKFLGSILITLLNRTSKVNKTSSVATLFFCKNGSRHDDRITIATKIGLAKEVFISMADGSVPLHQLMDPSTYGVFTKEWSD